MKFPKATMSKDGEKRFSIKIEFRVDAQFFENLLKEMALDFDYNINEYFDIKELNEQLEKFNSQLTKIKIWKEAKNLIENRGYNWFYDHTWFGGEETNKIFEEWISNKVKFFFPELF